MGLIRRPWRRAALWLSFLAALFYLSYGGANAIAARRADVPSVAFGWERRIPFLDWTIIPYCSINVFYAVSLFVCATDTELSAHARRLLTAQIVAVTCFLLFPLRFMFHRPETHGLSGVLFSELTRFDQPFNEAPSLHIAFLVILWRLYTRHVPRLLLWPLHLWFMLIGVSVLTTYQHHVFDVPTGALLGVFCLRLWPYERPSPLWAAKGFSQRRAGARDVATREMPPASPHA